MTPAVSPSGSSASVGELGRVGSVQSGTPGGPGRHWVTSTHPAPTPYDTNRLIFSVLGISILRFPPNRCRTTNSVARFK